MVLFWYDRRIPNSQPLRNLIYGPLSNSNERVQLSQVWHQGSWNFDSISMVIPQDLIHHIKNSFFANPKVALDTLVWTINGKGTFSTSGAYHHLIRHNTNLKFQSDKSFNWLWCLPIDPKIKFFMWLLHHDRLPTSLNIARKGLDISPHCKHYPNIIEDTNHLFFNCPSTNSIWADTFSEASCSPTGNLSNLFNTNWSNVWRIIKHKAFSCMVLWHEIFPHCLWEIWKTRNHNIFQQKTVKHSFSQAYSEATEYST